MVTAAIGAAAALGGAIYGSIKSKQFNDKARRLISEQRDSNKAWYESRMAEDYTQRTDAQSVLNKQREMLNEQYGRARATNTVAGGTDESLALQKAAANGAMAQTMSDIAADAASRKDAVEQSYRQQDAALNQQQIAGLQQQGQQAAQAGQQVANAGLSLMGTGLQRGNFINKQDA